MIVKDGYTIVPAGPDWYVVSLVHGDNDEDYSLALDPVLAWAMIFEESRDNKWTTLSAFPILIDGLRDREDDVVYKRPDGLFDAPFIATFETEEQVIEELKVQYERRMNRRRQDDKRSA